MPLALPPTYEEQRADEACHGLFHSRRLAPSLWESSESSESDRSGKCESGGCESGGGGGASVKNEDIFLRDVLVGLSVPLFTPKRAHVKLVSCGRIFSSATLSPLSIKSISLNSRCARQRVGEHSISLFKTNQLLLERLLQA